MNTTRVENTRRNIIWSYIDFAISILFQFVSRTIILQVLGIQYLGLSSLFSSILNVLNMTELGFSSAVVFNLYKPIANNDTKTVNALLAFYRKIYRIVGMVILSLGLLISPFIQSLIKGDIPADINIYALYYLYLANTVISYFVFSYRASLLNAVQRMDLTKIAYSIVHVCQCMFQMLTILIFKNYYLFVVGTILGTTSKNIIAAYFSNKYFPQYKCFGSIDNETKKDIWQRVKGLLIGKISGVTYTTFDSIILSAMIGLAPVAIYNNYMTIYSAVANIIVLIRHAMQASVGNSIASESIEKNYKDVLKWQFLFSMIAIWCADFLFCLYQPFMKLWMGSDMLLSIVDVIILYMLFEVSTVQHAFYLYLSGYGLWWHLRWPNILSTITNLILNIVLCRIWGITGIILATLIAQFVFGLLWQGSIVFKEYFKMSYKPYLIRQGIYFFVGILLCVVSYAVCSFIENQGITGIILRTIVCAIVPPVVIILFFHKVNEFNESKRLLIKVIHKNV